MRLISNCCGAKVAYEDFDKGTGICCDCKEWCEFIDEDKEDDTEDDARAKMLILLE